MGDADVGIDIPCKIIFACLIVSEAAQVDAPDNKGCVTEDDNQECSQSLPPESPCINTSFSYIGKHIISEWNFPESYSDDYDINGENSERCALTLLENLV